MTRTCYLHIGLPKTGSSSIQISLRGYSDERVRYAKMLGANHSIPLLVLYASDISRHAGLFPIARYLNKPHRLRQLYCSVLKRAFDASIGGRGDVILSGESLCGRLSMEDLGQLRSDLLMHFDRIRVIAYVRPYLSLAASAWQQKVKMGAKRLFVPAPAYRVRLEPFLDVFGKDNLELISFEKENLVGGDVVADFACRVGIKGEMLNIKRVNESHSLEALSVIMDHNRADVSDLTVLQAARWRNATVKALLPFGSTKLGFSRELLLSGLQQAQPDIDWISGLMATDMVGKVPDVAHPITDEKQVREIARAARPGAMKILDEAGVFRPAAKRRGRTAAGGTTVSQPGGKNCKAKPDRWVNMLWRLLRKAGLR